MRNDLKKELAVLEKQEQRLLLVPARPNRLKQTLYEKVPQGLRAALEAAFSKAFRLVFLRGTQLIEKTFDKETAELDYEAGNYVVGKAASKKSLRRLDRSAKRDNLLNNAATTVSGLGMGLLGLGLPDIPLLVGTLLKGVYETALGYGFHYESEEEQCYILRLICTALSEEDRQEWNRKLEAMEYASGSLDTEIDAAAKVLSDALLVEKFVQGLPIVGVVGGFVNHAVYRKTATWAALKYKKRYLCGKLKGLQSQ